MRHSLLLAMMIFTSSCRLAPGMHPSGLPSKKVRNEPAETALGSWMGIYASPAEIGGYSRTVLRLYANVITDDALAYQMKFRSDVRDVDAIEQEELWGSCLVEGDRVYIPTASGTYRDGKPWLMASIDRYTKRVINGHEVLLRDDALKVFDESNKLYDYGILIKLPKGDNDPLIVLDDVEHPSVKTLYKDPSKGWKDPFVSGPNDR